jgi:hypothetical protein
MKTTARELTLKHRETVGHISRNESDEDDDDDRKRDLLESQSNQGRYLFRFNGRVLVFYVHIYIYIVKKVEQSSSTAPFIQVGRPSFEDLEVSISCFSIWAGVSPPSRPLDSVTLADDKKVPLVQDMESYLSKEI